MSVITHEQMKECFEPAYPLNGYVIAEVTDKPSERLLASGLVLPQSAEDGTDRPYLLLRVVPEEIKKEYLINEGDVVEAFIKTISYTYGQNMEKLAIFKASDIVAVYRRIPGTNLDLEAMPKTKPYIMRNN